MRLLFDIEKEEAEEKDNRSTEQLNAENWKVKHIDWTTIISDSLTNYQAHHFHFDGSRYFRYQRRN